jgi:hypothetical protein
MTMSKMSPAAKPTPLFFKSATKGGFGLARVCCLIHLEMLIAAFVFKRLGERSVVPDVDHVEATET